MLCGHTLYHCGKPLVHKYPLDLDDICEGSTVGVMVTSEGELHYSLNGQDMGCAVRGITAGETSTTGEDMKTPFIVQAFGGGGPSNNSCIRAPSTV